MRPSIGRGRGEDGGALLKKEGDIAFEVDGVAGVDAGGEDDGAAAGIRGGFDCGVDGGRVDGGTVAFRSEGANIEVDRLCRCGWRRGWLRLRRSARRIEQRGGTAGDGKSGHL